MHFFRNPEIQKDLVRHVAATALTAVILFFLFPLLPERLQGSLLPILFLFVCLTFGLLHFSATFRRYQRLRRLSLDIDLMLHGSAPIDFRQYQEGELSLLQNEIQKLFLRIQEQSSRLLEDRQQLADSLADVSHQLRTPMTSIHLLISRLADPALPLEERRALLRQLTMLTERIDWLIEALLKLSRLDAGIVTLRPEQRPLQQLVEEAAAPLAIPMELRGQRLALTSETGQESFCGDFSWTVEAIGNILKNCMEHTEGAGQISVALSENAIYSQLIIEDEGPGFAPEDLPRLFERFYKGSNASQKSIGIGLALCRMILARENATVTAGNRPEGGARFVVRFYKDGAV